MGFTYVLGIESTRVSDYKISYILTVATLSETSLLLFSVFLMSSMTSREALNTECSRGDVFWKDV